SGSQQLRSTAQSCQTGVLSPVDDATENLINTPVCSVYPSTRVITCSRRDGGCSSRDRKTKNCLGEAQAKVAPWWSITQPASQSCKTGHEEERLYLLCSCLVLH
uniref:Uncharacterized protein n=1 Tax=Gasterosteus aculeatus aculeatus TaxID=481459 RepID=A0AAQ4PRL1_GASAC